MGVWKMPDQEKTLNHRRDIFTIDFTDYLPGALKHDPKMRALAAAVTKAALDVSGTIDNTERVNKMGKKFLPTLKLPFFKLN